MVIKYFLCNLSSLLPDAVSFKHRQHRSRNDWRRHVGHIPVVRRTDRSLILGNKWPHSVPIEPPEIAAQSLSVAVQNNVPLIVLVYLGLMSHAAPFFCRPIKLGLVKFQMIELLCFSI